MKNHEEGTLREARFGKGSAPLLKILKGFIHLFTRLHQNYKVNYYVTKQNRFIEANDAIVAPGPGV